MDLNDIRKFLDTLSQRHIPSCDVKVMLNGECVFRHLSGCRDAEGKLPLDGKEAYWMYSMTKPMTMACALRLIQEGKMALEDPVCKYLPEYSKHPTLTVEHLMSMRGGLDYDLNIPAVKELGPTATTRQLVAAMADKTFLFEPGTDFAYSLCHDVMAAIIEVVSGMRFSDYMEKTLWKPLGMENSSFHMTDYQRENMCAQYELQADGESLRLCGLMENGYALTPNYESGGAGLITTIDDYSKFVNAMATGGAGILEPETISLWQSRQLTGKARESFRGFNRIGYNYALGVRVMVDNENAESNIGEFGWDGAACSYCIIDPAIGLSAVVGMHIRNAGFVYGEIHPAIRDMIYKSLRDQKLIGEKI